VFKPMTGDSLAFTQAKEIPMSDPTDVQNSVERMKIHMELRGLRPMTVYTFTGYARRFLAHVGKAPAAVTAADVESFLLDLCRKDRAPRTRNVALAAVRCLLGATTSNDGTVGIPRAKVPRLSPKILSGSEVARLLASTDSPKYRAIFTLAYGAGLRVSEITGLQVADIDGQRMVIHVREGKTGARHVMLSPRVLEALRTYWKAARPAGPELFPGGRSQRPGTQLTRESIHKVLGKVARQAGIKKHVHPHMLRHCFATHMIEAGADIRSVQVLLGHACIESTTTYLHLSNAHLRASPSPIDVLGTPAGNVLG
jgi:site-specific recombinase XerD